MMAGESRPKRMTSFAASVCSDVSNALTGLTIVATVSFASVMPFAMAGRLSTPSELLALIQGRFPTVAKACEDPPVAILVPGGGLETYIAAVTQGGIPPGSGQRITVALDLARTYPSANLMLSGTGEDDPTALFAAAGIEPRRVIRETMSRNTFENAAWAARILRPRRDQCFVLVTSALHMPRAVGSYRAAGFNVSTRSVDFHHMSEPNIAEAVWNEFIGLILYRLAWRTHEVFPREAILDSRSFPSAGVPSR